MLPKLLTRYQMLKSDRGEGPVPYIIIVSIIAILAVTVAIFLRTTATTWMNTVPQTAP